MPAIPFDGMLPLPSWSEPSLVRCVIVWFVIVRPSRAGFSCLSKCCQVCSVIRQELSKRDGIDVWLPDEACGISFWLDRGGARSSNPAMIVCLAQKAKFELVLFFIIIAYHCDCGQETNGVRKFVQIFILRLCWWSGFRISAERVHIRVDFTASVDHHEVIFHQFDLPTSKSS
jgi:hypothetical protein